MTTKRIFSSQDPDDLRRDPLPYVDRITGERRARPGWMTTIYKPRPEYRLQLPHPTNHALVALRDQAHATLADGMTEPDVFYRGFVTVLDGEGYEPDQAEHAREVALRLARLAAGAS